MNGLSMIKQFGTIFLTTDMPINDEYCYIIRNTQKEAKTIHIDAKFEKNGIF